MWIVVALIVAISAGPTLLDRIDALSERRPLCWMLDFFNALKDILVLVLVVPFTRPRRRREAQEWRETADLAEEFALGRPEDIQWMRDRAQRLCER